jgi:hypothetical protein
MPPTLVVYSSLESNIENTRLTFFNPFFSQANRPEEMIKAEVLSRGSREPKRGGDADD